METNDIFSKKFFQNAWGEDGYYENFSYGVGIDEVCKKALTPFFDADKTALEIGSGGGVFTERMVGKFKELIAIDVIKKPSAFTWHKNFRYIELPDMDFYCTGVYNDTIDFAFSYNVFCHLSNGILAQYMKSVHRTLNPGADFVFMLSNFDKIKVHLSNGWEQYKLGDHLPTGHFYQNESTIDFILYKDQWDVVSTNLLPDHRDIIVHLKKK